MSTPAVTKRLSTRGKPSARSRGRAARVVVLAGERMGETFTLPQARTTIGRGVTADIRINDEGISRTHAAVFFEDDVYYLTDAGSTNGTYANGERVDRHPLLEGDRIQLGAACILRFTYEDEGGGDPRMMFESALRDPQTGLFSENYFKNRLEGDVASALRHGKPLALVMVDVDGFDELLAARGDAVASASLRALGRTVRGITREADVLARHGRAGFGLVCRDADAMRAARAAARISRTVADSDLSSDGGEAISLTVSIGVADLATLRAPTAQALVEAAEKALLVAQRGGPGRIEIYDPEGDPTHHV